MVFCGYPGFEMFGTGVYGVYGGIGMIFGIIFLALLIAGIVWLVNSLLKNKGFHGTFGSSGSNGPIELPLDILKRRYASGEIKKKEFEEMKKEIGK